jgi:adenine-specific DNA-methyltransferase
MSSTILSPKQALNKAFLKVKPNRSAIEDFKSNLINLIDKINEAESEEFHKNLVSDFLKQTYYIGNHFINTKDRNDLVIHTGKNAQTPVGVIIEAKRPSNKAEMLSTGKLNVKALQELVLYYLRERITLKNLEIKYLVATNIYEWFIFDAAVFEKVFAQNKKLVKQFTDFESGNLSGTKTDFFYKEIAEPAIAAAVKDLEYTHFDIRDYDKPLRNADKRDDNKLIALYKLLSPEHLLKLPFANDSNSLDKAFYSELLHIIGLTEIKEKSKKLIQRKNEGERDTGSLLENAITRLDSLDKISRLDNPQNFGDNNQARLFNVGLELVITWINRILFLKLLEAQQVNYHKGDKAYAFLNLEMVQNYDDLNSLFFDVLARKPEDRNADVKNTFAKVPYLNSSLFEPTGIEHGTIFISNLRDERILPILSSTVLKNSQGKKRSGELNAIEYLFEFLNSYDFSSEGSEDIQEDNKTLINASVLGLIFEKINGYKDGSFFTPGFITMYMCRETIRRAVVQKFNDAYNWQCKDIDQLYDMIKPDKKLEANELINSLKICDPAVGSGHFLVSALNEIIAVKSDLKILLDRDHKTLRDYHVEVVNDELIITDDDGSLFDYNPKSTESRRVQEALFHEKQTIIENCLFGVDINHNSVKICRLRLWIELLKSAYYKVESNYTELETLPNIDINIKCGNSLISRYALDADIKTALRKSKWSIESYRMAIMGYRNAKSKEEKRDLEKIIDTIKNDFESEINHTDKRVKRLDKLKNELNALMNQPDFFEISKTEKARINKEIEKKTKAIKKLQTEIDDIKNNKIYQNAFEWRFEFPEVLNDDGDFIGFDIIIGNPPYGVFLCNEEKLFLKKNYKITEYNYDTYNFFFELSINILKNTGFLGFITPNTFLVVENGVLLRKFLFKENRIIELYETFNVFSDAVVEPMTSIIQKIPAKEYFEFNVLLDSRDKSKLTKLNFSHEHILKKENLIFNYRETEQERELHKKINSNSKPLSIYAKVTTGIKPYQTGKGVPQQTKEVVVNKPFTSFRKQEDWSPIIRGAQIRKYNTNWDGEYIKYGEWLAEPRNPDIFFKPKLFIRRTDDNLLCSYDSKNFIGINSVHCIQTSAKELCDKYLLAQINSKLCTWVFQHENFHMVGKPLAEVKVVFVERLPIVATNHDSQKLFVIKADKMLDLNQKLQEKKSKFLNYVKGSIEIERISKTLELFYDYDFKTLIGEFKKQKIKLSLLQQDECKKYFSSSKSEINKLQAEISTTDRAIDRMVYELYDLTKEEIKIIEAGSN